MPIRILTLLTMATCASAASEVPIIWEQQIFDLNRYAASLLDEAYRMFESPTSDWDVVGTYNRGLQVFSRPVQGSKLLLVRSSVEVPKDAQDLFKLLMMSADGAAIIDDTTNHTDGPYETLKWHDRAEISYSKTIASKFPFPGRSFVKASFFETAQSIAVSKSILYKQLPEGQDGLTRAFNSFALRTVPLSEGRCRLEIVDFFDMRGWFSTWVANLFHKQQFCQNLHGRLWKYLDSQKTLQRFQSSAARAS